MINPEQTDLNGDGVGDDCEGVYDKMAYVNPLYVGMV